MPFIIGWMLGEVLTRIGFMRALGSVLLLVGTGLLANRLVAINLSPDHAVLAGFAAPAVLFAWAVWHPTSSRFRLWIVDGVYLGSRFAMWGFLFAFAVALPMTGFRLDAWLWQGWPWAALAALSLLVQRALEVQVKRSHLLMGERSALKVDV